MNYLSLREHSRLELGRKLARHAEEGEDLDALLDLLEQKGFLSTERFKESLVRRRSENYGNHRILAELQTHRLSPELLAQTKAELNESESARACAVWQKKFGHDPENCGVLTPEQRAKQMRYLAQRGFSSRSIQAALSNNCDQFEE